MIKNKFHKKIFTLKTFIKDSVYILIKIPEIFLLLKKRKIEKTFMEKIMTIVTTVNGCRYCTWFHAKQAASAGISKREIKNMLNLQFKTDANDFELPGLLYAQHYAETNRNPDKEMTDKILKHYGETTANNIILTIRMIFYGNLQGNTFDAFLSRLKGAKVPNSNLFFELCFFMINAPVMLPLILLMKKHN